MNPEPDHRTELETTWKISSRRDAGRGLVLRLRIQDRNGRWVSRGEVASVVRGAEESTVYMVSGVQWTFANWNELLE